jgi:cytochrome c5
MKLSQLFKAQLRRIPLLIACISMSLLCGGVTAQQAVPPKDASPSKESTPAPAQSAPTPTQSAPAAKQSPPPPKKAEKRPPKKLNGAELYALHCNRCHPERYAPERTAEQWKTILLHMRTRANLPAEQARAILQFLQEDSGK